MDNEYQAASKVHLAADITQSSFQMETGDFKKHNTFSIEYILHGSAEESRQVKGQSVAENQVSEPTTRSKRARKIFNGRQLEFLELEFSRQQYVAGLQRSALAAVLGLTVTQVKVWFQNRRIKWRKELLKHSAWEKSC